MGFEWMQDAVAMSPFPEKKLTIKVPQRKPVSLDILPPLRKEFTEDAHDTAAADIILQSEEDPAHVDAIPEPKYSNLVAFHDGILLSPTGMILSERTDDIRAHYLMGKELGRGHFGVVRQCERIGAMESVACKSISKQSLKKKEEIKELQAEIGIMERLGGNSNIVQLKNVFEDSESVHLVMELCKEGDLFDYIARKRRLPEAEAAKIFRQVVLGVQFCHSRGVIHRDLKPENILFAKISHDNHGALAVKLADFGLAVVVNPGEQTTGLAGSPFYMAPELVRRRSYGAEIDVWSLGVILYTALSGFLPFWGKTHEQTFAAVCRGEADFIKKPWQTISPEAKSLVRKMLTMDPKRRATIDDILTHPWILAHCPRSAPKSRPKPFIQNANPKNLPSKPGFSFQSQNQTPPLSPRECGEMPHTVPQALSAPKGQFSPPRTPSPLSSPRNMPPKPSISQFMLTPPGTPKKEGESSHVTPFAAALAKPFRFLQHSKDVNLAQLQKREDREKERERGVKGDSEEKECEEREHKPPQSPAQTTPRPFFLSEPFQKFSKGELILDRRPVEGNGGKWALTERKDEKVVPEAIEEDLSETKLSAESSEKSDQEKSNLLNLNLNSNLDFPTKSSEISPKSIAGHLSSQLRKMVC